MLREKRKQTSRSKNPVNNKINACTLLSNPNDTSLVLPAILLKIIVKSIKITLKKLNLWLTAPRGATPVN